MGIYNLQSNFNKGELDPLLLGRGDLEAYYGGCKQAKSVVTLPQGGIARRSGTEYLAELPESARLETFSFNETENYLLAFTNLRMYIFKDGVQQLNIAGSGNDYIVTIVPSSHLFTLDYTQSYDTIILSHPELPPQVISRISDSNWTIADVVFVNQPQYDFDDSSSPPTTAEVQSLVFANVTAGDRYRLTVDDFLTEDIVWSDTVEENENRIVDALHSLKNTGRTGITVSGSSLTYTITFGGGSAGPYGLTTATPVLTNSVDFEGESTRTTAGVSAKEDSWSVARGYPNSSTFHNNRLWFGGSKSRPSTVWGSVIGQYYDFDEGKGRDDEMVELVLDSDELNAVRHLVSNKKLQILTTGQHFYIPEDVITPKASVISVDNQGAGSVSPVKLDSDILYANRTGKRLNRFEMVNEYQPTATQSLAILASHLINSPVSMAASRGTSSTDANYVYIVNFDGSMIVLNTLKNEGVEGFTEWTTNGHINSVAVSGDQMYMTVTRGGRVLLERSNPDAFYDSTVFAEDSDTLNMGHLTGEVGGKGDGYNLGTKTISGGNAVFDASYSALQAGLEFTPIVETMPVNIALGNGPQVSKKKRKRRAFVRVYETAGLVVDGNTIFDRAMGAEPFAAPVPATEQKEVLLRGWSRDATITITQNGPFPMTILSVNIEVSI